MRINSTKFKRVQAMVLALAMMLSTFTFALDFGVSALDDPKEFEKTEGEIVADNYELTDAEKNLLKSGFLVGSTHSYNKPDNDDLIKVDIENKVITAEDYQGWVPVSCDIVVGDEVKASGLKFVDNKVAYTYDGDVFSVKVYYELTESVDEDVQNALLTGPAALKEGLSYLDAINKAEEYLALVSNGEVIDVIGQMGTESGYKFYFGNPNDPTILTVRFYTDEGKAAALALRQQTISNSGENFDISKLVSEYISADSEVQYLVENSADVYAKLVETYGYINSLLNDKQPGDVQSTNLEMLANYAMIFEPSLSTPFNALIKGMKDWVAVVKPLVEDTWMINEAPVVKEGLTPVQYKALDTMVDALGDDLKGTSATVKNPLLVDTATVQFNMSMSNVTVKVVLNVVDNTNTVVTYNTKTTTITLADGATKADVLAEVGEKNLVANAIAAWGEAYVDGQYVAAYSELPETVDKDIEYVITYSPKTYTVTTDYDGEKVYPYGYNLALPLHSDATKAYDYTIGGTYYAQGSIVKITGDVEITRKEGKAYTSSTLNKVVSDNLFTNDSKAQAILNSGALLVGNTTLNVRYPDNDNKIVKLDGTTLTAQAYPSSYEGLNWVPYSYTVNGDVKFFGEDNEVEIGDANFDYVSVVYCLKLTNLADAEVLKIANLPSELVTAANDQLSVLNRLNSKYTEMESINKATFGAANGMIDVQDGISDEIKSSMKAAISGVINQCCGADGKLNIYGMLTTYNDPNNGGLKYYYTNSAKFISEIDKLAGYLSDLLDTEEEREALAKVLTAAGFGAYTEKIADLNSLMAEIKADLKAPDERIDLTSDKLGALCKALTSEGTPASFTEIDALVLNSNAITVNADGKETINVTVGVAGGAEISIAPQIFNKDHVLTESEVESIVVAIEAAIAELNVSETYYVTDYDASVLAALIGQNVSDLESTEFKFTWSPKEFTVKVEGAEDQIVTNNSLTIKLPSAPAGEGVRYDYIIGGVTYSSGEYNFTLEELEELFVDGELTIEKVVVDIARDDLINYVNDLNATIGNDDVVFVLTENDEGYSIVLKMNMDDPAAMTGTVQKLATALATGRYTYIAFDKEAFIYSVDNSTKISLQALINTVMNSGFGTNKIVSLMDANGNINNINMPGTIISGKNVNTAGGEIAKTVFVLGDDADNISYEIPMYITLGSVSSEFVELRNLIANQLSQYFAFTCANGKASIALNMPQKAYEAYLAVLLATDNVDITDINAVNDSVAAGFLLDVIYPLMNSDASITSVQNTLAKFGYNIDLTGYDKAFEVIRNFYKEHYPANENSANKISVNISIAQYLSSLGEMSGMIVEKETGIDISAEATIINLARDYEAIFFDIGAEGLLNKFGLVVDVADKLTDMAGTSVVILLKDIDNDLKFTTTTLLNLNGCVVNGDIIGNGVKIVDSAVDVDNIGGVNGTLYGKVSVMGGKYADGAVADYLPEGYAQYADGVVRNEFVNIERDKEGNITVKLNAGILATRVLPDVKSLAADIFVELLINGYTANKLDFEGYKVFEITVDDLVGIYTSNDKKNAVIDRVLEMVDPSDLVEIMKLLVADFTDFDSFKASLDSDLANGEETPLLSYDITTGVWGLETTYIEEDDSISIDITTKHVTDRKLDIVITGDKADKQHLADLVGILAETTKVEIEIDKIQGGVNGSTIVFDAAVGTNLTLDFATNPKYGLMLSVLVADGIGSSANAGLLEGLKFYFEEDDISVLANEFNKLTVKQIFDAIKNFTRGDTFSAMIARLGLSEYDLEDAEELELLIDDYAKVLAAIIRRLDIDGTNDKLSKYFRNEDGSFTVDKYNVVREKTINLVSGYKLAVNAELTHLNIYVNIFGIKGEDLEPDFGEDKGNPTIITGGKVHNFRFDKDNNRFALDIDVNGILKTEFIALLSFDIENCDDIVIEVLCDGDYVCNGAKVKVTAKNGDKSADMEFNVVIFGDIAGDGRIDNQDVDKLRDSFGNNTALEGFDRLASDINGDDSLSIRDLVYIIAKIKSGKFAV